MKWTLLAGLLAAAHVRGDASSYDQNAVCNTDQLARWYNKDTGLWSAPDGGIYWWQAANMLTALTDLALEDENVKNNYGYIWETTYNNAPANNPSPAAVKAADGTWTKVYTAPSKEEVERRKLKRDDNGFINDYYDDEAWWALAFIGAYDNSGDSKYLDEAIAIWYDMNAAWGQPSCGGLPWNKDGVGPLAIENELYISLGAVLANRVGDDQKNTYLDAAKDAWTWFQNSGMINGDNLINDGVDSTSCQNNGQPTYSYNQGVIIGGLVELYHATGDESYLDPAAAIADAVTTPGSSMLDDNGILVDSCDQDQTCSGDGVQFKGAFPRNLKKLQAVRNSDQWKGFLETNAQSIWNNDLSIVDGGCLNGVYWAGPYADADPSSQSSALDALVAALAVNS